MKISLRNLTGVKLIGIILCILHTGYYAEGQVLASSPNSKADSLWNVLDLYIKPIDNKVYSELDRIEEIGLLEYRKQNYRIDGLKFWRSYPNDTRKYVWLENTILRNPDYWANIYEGAKAFCLIDTRFSIPLNIMMIANWERDYENMRNEYLNNKSISLVRKLEFQTAELKNMVSLNTNAMYRKNSLFSLEKLQKLFMDAATRFTAVKSNGLEDSLRGNYVNPFLLMESFINYSKTTFGFSYEELSAFFVSIERQSSDSIIKKWIQSKVDYLSTTHAPLKFKYTSVDRKRYSSESLKGKILIMDYWHTSCGPCIKMMPRLKEIYYKYKDQGLEVLSISINAQNEIEKVQKIEREIDAGWPLFILGGKENSTRYAPYREIFDRFSWVGVPRMIILDRNGLLVGSLGDFLAPGFENFLQKLLTEKHDLKVKM